jgi:hypothetical protein
MGKDRITEQNHCKNTIVRRATGDKTTKTKVLPGFCKIEHGSGNEVAATVPVLSAKNLPSQP